jgi:hypothetical protein
MMDIVRMGFLWFLEFQAESGAIYRSVCADDTIRQDDDEVNEEEMIRSPPIGGTGGIGGITKSTNRLLPCYISAENSVEGGN